MNTPATNPHRVLVGVMLVLLLGAINQTIVAVALPRIADRLDGFALMAWVISGYLVAATVVTPIYGKLFDRHGVRVILAWAIALFAIGSLGCAVSTSMPMLVAFRVLQGLGGGGLVSGSHAAIAQTVSPRERGRYQAYFSGMFAGQRARSGRRGLAHRPAVVALGVRREPAARGDRPGGHPGPAARVAGAGGIGARSTRRARCCWPSGWPRC